MLTKEAGDLLDHTASLGQSWNSAFKAFNFQISDFPVNGLQTAFTYLLRWSSVEFMSVFSVSPKWVYQSQTYLDNGIAFSLLSFLPWRSGMTAWGEWPKRLWSALTGFTSTSFKFPSECSVLLAFPPQCCRSPMHLAWAWPSRAEYKASHILVPTPSPAPGTTVAFSASAPRCSLRGSSLSLTWFPPLSVGVPSALPVASSGVICEGLPHHLSSLDASCSCCFSSNWESDEAQWSLHRPPRIACEFVRCPFCPNSAKKYVHFAPILLQSCDGKYW